jgi:MFS family permease
LLPRRGRDHGEALIAFKSGKCSAVEGSLSGEPRVGQRGPRGSKAETCILLFLALLPVAAIVRLISEYGVNVPWGDEWSVVPMFAKWHDHQLTFSDLVRQHNEHRIFLPKLIYLAFAQWTHWNVKAEMFFSVLLCCANSAGIYLLLERTVPGTSRKRLLLWALINLLIFAPVQAENWLWGFQLQMFLPNLCLVACLVLFTSRLPDAAKITGALLVALIATFSFGGGLLLWPAIAFYVVLQRVSARWLIAWIAGFLLVAVVYFTGYKRLPVASPELGNQLDHLTYFANFLGIALSRSSLSTHAAIAATMIGTSGFLLYLIACWVCLKLSPITRASAAAWLALGAYAIGSAVLAAYTRVSGGPQQALNSRYATISLNLYVGLIGFIAIAAHAARAELPARLAQLVTSAKAPFFTVIITLSALSFSAGIDHMEILRRLRLEGAARLQFCKVISPSEKLRTDLVVDAALPTLVENADLLDRLHLLNPPLRRSSILRDGEDRPQRSTTEFGRSDDAVRKDADILEMRGWSFLPDRSRPAPCVVLAYEAAGNWTALGLVEPGERRPDVVRQMKSKKYLGSGWRAAIHRKLLPPGATRLSAWAFDPETGAVYKLPGDFLLLAR